MNKKVIYIAIYFISFFVSFLGFKYTDYLYTKKGNNYLFIGIIFGVLPLCLLAAFRNDNIGTDILVYGKSTFQLAESANSLKSYISIYNNDILFGLLAFTISHLGGSIKMFWFFIEFLCVFPIYFIAVKKSKEVPIEFTMLVYMFIYYPMSFNIMRQSIATSFFLLAFFWLFDGKNKYCLIFTVIGLLFHASSVVSVLLCFIVYWIVKIKSRKERWLLLIIFVFAFLLLYINWNLILDFAVNTIKILPLHYAYYLNVFSENSYNLNLSYYFQIGTYGIIEFIFRIIMVILPLVIHTLNGKYNDEQVRIYRYLSVISIYIYGMSMLIFGTTYGYRITMLLDLFNVFYLSSMYKRNSDKNMVVSIVVFIFSVAYFYIIYSFFGAHEVVPYVIAQG